MVMWREIEAAAPELAGAVQQRFGATLHKTMATLRRDGAPRISGTEVVFADGDVWVGSMSGAMKARDLLRDGRCALHNAPVDEKLSDGDAKLAGHAVEVTDRNEIKRAWPDADESEHLEDFHAFRIDVTEVVLTTVDGDKLVVRSWNPQDGERVVRR